MPINPSAAASRANRAQSRPCGRGSGTRPDAGPQGAGGGGSVALARLFGRQIIIELTEAGVFSDEADSEDEDGKQYQNL